MISPLTFAALLLAAAAGLCLYQAKHRAEVLDGQIAGTLRQGATARERIELLRAEWALLDEPRRLSALVRQQRLGLRPLAASQFVALPDLAARLQPRPGPDASPRPIPAHTPRLAHAQGPGRP